QRVFDRKLLRPRHDVGNHGTRDKVPVMQDAVGPIGKMDADKRPIPEEFFGGELNEFLALALVGNICWEVRVKDIFCTLLVRAIDTYLNVQAARTHDGSIDQLITVGCADDDDVVELFHAVELRE